MLQYLSRALISISKPEAGARAGGEQEEKKGELSSACNGNARVFLELISPYLGESGDCASQARPDCGALPPEMVRSLFPP